MCSLNDIRYYEDNTIIWEIDKSGEPLVEVDRVVGELNNYWCTECDVALEDFEKVKEHVSSKGVIKWIKS